MTSATTWAADTVCGPAFASERVVLSPSPPGASGASWSRGHREAGEDSRAWRHREAGKGRENRITQMGLVPRAKFVAQAREQRTGQRRHNRLRVDTWGSPQQSSHDQRDHHKRYAQMLPLHNRTSYSSGRDWFVVRVSWSHPPPSIAGLLSSLVNACTKHRMTV